MTDTPGFGAARQLAAALLFALAGATSAGAQVRLLPRTSSPGAMESYVLQVANTHQQAITRVELRFPRSVRVISVGERPDWPAQVVYTDDRLAAAVWTGALAPTRYTEFGFLGVNATKRVIVVWPVIVTYADGEQVAWWPNSIGTKAPATLITAAPRDGNTAIAFAVCLLAFVLALAALALALRGAPAKSNGFHHGE